jgi:hypothetical protein
MFWSRFGKPLQEPVRPDGTQYLSGSEWEYEDARQAGVPILLFRRTEDPQVSLRDREVSERRQQLERVDQFFERFAGPVGSRTGSFISYTTASQFRVVFKRVAEGALRQLLELGEQRHSPSAQTRIDMLSRNYEKTLDRLGAGYLVENVVKVETVIIVVGSAIIAELLDRPLAEKIRGEIDDMGKSEFQRAVIITDVAWYREANQLAENAVIAVGGPTVNDLTGELEWIRRESGESDERRRAGGASELILKNKHGRPQLALWGEEAVDTKKVVEQFLRSSKKLQHFLEQCWRG